MVKDGENYSRSTNDELQKLRLEFSRCANYSIATLIRQN